MSVADWFACFCSALRVSSTDVISTRYRRITKRLNTDFWSTSSETSHSLYVGSYGRNTAIEGFSDLDMIFELPSHLYYRYDGYEGNGQSALLQSVRNSIRNTYADSNVGADGQVVAVPFWDITFEVVPVFFNTSGSYTFPDSNGGGRWRTTNPRPEIKAIRDRNIVCNNNLVPLCRMMRAWKREWTVPIGGLLIDTLAYRFIKDWLHRERSYLYYDFMCRDFLAYLADQNREQQYWLAPGSEQYVYRKGLFEHKAKQCYNYAVEAIQYQLDGYEWSAKQKWRDIFGGVFPS